MYMNEIYQSKKGDIESEKDMDGLDLMGRPRLCRHYT